MRWLTLTACALCAALSACSGGDERPTLNLEIFEAIRSTANERLNPEPARPPVTRALLDTLEGAFMEVTVEERDQVAYLFVSASGYASDGTVQIIWRSEDDVNLAMRNDVLLSVHGIGGDLISSDVRVGPNRIGPQPGSRRMVFAARDNQGVPLSFTCSVADAGAATITIVERSHQTRKYQERCTGPSGSFVNEYWIDSTAGLAWQSRQWAGPDTGYLKFRRLTAK